MGSEEATFGIDPDLTPRGTYIQPNRDVVRGFNMEPAEKVGLLVNKTEAVARSAVKVLVLGLAIGSPVLFGLAFAGLVGHRWSRETAVDCLHMVALFGLAVFGTFFIYYQGAWRFYLLPLAFMCVWAGFGIQLAGDGMAAVTRRLRGGGLPPSATSAGVLLACLGILVPSAVRIADAFAANRAGRQLEAVAEQLAGRGDLTVAGTSTVVAFHAGADFVWLPFCDAATALRFLKEQGATHVVVDGGELFGRPYLADWFEHGVPGAVPVASIESGPGRIVRIFEFERNLRADGASG